MKKIPNSMCERTLTLSTLDWSSIRNMTFQVTDVTKALGSVSKIVANGNKEVFDGSGSFIENKRSRERLWVREENGVYVLDVYVAPPDCHEKKKDFSQAGTSLASSPVRPFDEKSRKGVSGSRNNLGVLSEAGPAADDQMESESDMSREREFFGSESEDDMKISHAVSKADSDEEMIQTGDMRAGADDPGSEETKSVKMKKTPRQPSQCEREEHERTHLPFRDWLHTVSKPNPGMTGTRERPMR